MNKSVIRSPIKKKFAVPRQPGLAARAPRRTASDSAYNRADAVRGPEFSHLWVLFVFHQTMDGGWRPTVRPPLAVTPEWVLATRSTFAPSDWRRSLR
ncbi:SAM-dependent methyltransferase [Salmonella enterica subsp. enterica]|nr:SAM-dependent methyltransferase [Salmonella enterica subsp. enterica]